MQISHFGYFRLPIDLFRSTVHRLQTFISINLFPSRLDNNNNTSASLMNGWWIPCAIRTLALFSKFGLFLFLFSLIIEIE